MKTTYNANNNGNTPQKKFPKMVMVFVSMMTLLYVTKFNEWVPVEAIKGIISILLSNDVATLQYVINMLAPRYVRFIKEKTVSSYDKFATKLYFIAAKYGKNAKNIKVNKMLAKLLEDGLLAAYTIEDIEGKRMHIPLHFGKMSNGKYEFTYIKRNSTFVHAGSKPDEIFVIKPSRLRIGLTQLGWEVLFEGTNNKPLAAELKFLCPYGYYHGDITEMGYVGEYSSLDLEIHVNYIKTRRVEYLDVFSVLKSMLETLKANTNCVVAETIDNNNILYVAAVCEMANIVHSNPEMYTHNNRFYDDNIVGVSYTMREDVCNSLNKIEECVPAAYVSMGICGIYEIMIASLEDLSDMTNKNNYLTYTKLYTVINKYSSHPEYEKIKLFGENVANLFLYITEEERSWFLRCFTQPWDIDFSDLHKLPWNHDTEA